MDQGLSYIQAKSDDPLSFTTVGEIIKESSEKSKDVVAVYSREQKKKITLVNFLEEIDNLAVALYDIGLKRNDKIGIIVNNSVEALMVNFACIAGGFISVNLNPALQPPELEYFLKKLEIKCIITIDFYKNFNILDILKKVIPEMEISDSTIIQSEKVPSMKNIIVISDTKYRGTYSYKTIMALGKGISKETLNSNKKQINCHDIFTILFTSGTTGNPKIVGLTHFQMNNCINFTSRRLPLRQRQKFCFNLPLFHVFGLGFCILCLMKGITIVLPSLYYNPEKNLQTLSEENCTHIMGTPTMLADMVMVQRQLNLPISPLLALCGGAAGSEQLYKDILKVLNVQQLKLGYGATETICISWSMLEDFNDFASVGYLMEHLEAKVVDIYGNLVPVGTIGELYVRGYSIIKNYLYSDVQLLDEDNWFKTGDAVFMHIDGKITCTGRLKDIINRGGEKISPGEVEEILESHPNIIEAYVVGSYHERLGEEVCACFKLKPGTSITLEEIKKFCKGKISYYKIPSKIEIMESFPKTLLGKIQKSKLLEIVNTHIKI